MTPPDRKPLRAFFSYFGAKHRIAGKYPLPLPRGPVIEPFAGSAAYACRYWWRDVILVEKDPVIASIWRYLLTADPREVLSIPDVRRGISTVDDLPEWVPAGARALVGFWTGIGVHSLHRTQTPVSERRLAMTNVGIQSTCAQAWCADIRWRLAKQLPMVRHWRLIEGDYTEAPDVAATWFIDPPCERAGKSYKCGSGAIDFAALGHWCRSRRGRSIVCENDGARWLPFRRFVAMAGPARTAGAGPAKSVEAIWTQDSAGAAA